MIAFLHDPIGAWPSDLVTYRDGIAAVLAVPVLLLALRLREGALGRRALLAVGTLGALAIAAFVVILAIFPFGVAYNDHAEPTITMIAWWRLQGHLVYPDWDRGEGFYGLIYGPLTFQVMGVALRAGFSVFATKLPGVAAAGLALAVLAVALRRVAPGEGFVRLLIVAGVAMILPCHGSLAFFTRPEPFMLLCACLGLLAFVRLRGVAGCVAIGVLAGVATGFKITAPLTFLGYALGLLAAEPRWGRRLAMAAAGAAVWAVVAALPFLDPAMTVRGYAKYFAMAADHGQDAMLLERNAMFGLLLLLPLAALPWRRLPTLDRAFAAGLAGGVLVVGFVAGKPGAGPHHLLPFLPGFAYVLLRGVQLRPAVAGRQVAAVLLLLLSITHGPGALKQMRSLGGLTVLDQPMELRQAEEVAAFARVAPGAVMGQGGDDGYRWAYHRVQTAFQGHPAALLEVPAWMEMEKAGASGDLPVSLLDGCRVKDWILPNAGAPFTIDGEYVHGTLQPVFSARFREVFARDYRMVRRGSFFSLWRCGAD